MKFSTVDAWLEWQAQLHTESIELGLDRIRCVFERLITSPIAKQVIVVAGTNGKGSTVSFLEAIYYAAGYRVGAYTSPHLQKYNERIRVCGSNIDDQTLCDAFNAVENAREDVPLTYFEFGTLAAFHVFSISSLDIAILEIGLGGRLDAVNLVDNNVAIITNVQLDHQDWLGQTREEIGLEKIAVGRSEGDVIFAEETLPENVKLYINNNGIKLHQIGKHFGFQSNGQSWLWWGETKKKPALPNPSLLGDYQFVNASSAIMATELLNDQLPVNQAHIRTGLTQGKLSGRFQVTQLSTDRQNLIIMDVAHNPHAMRACVKQLSKLPQIGECLVVFAVLKDKAVNEMIDILKPYIKQWFIGSLNIDRAMSVGELSKLLIAHGISTDNIIEKNSVESAFHAAESQLSQHDNILITGSFYTVAAMLDN